ncbi:spermidine synthase [Pyrodictium occultum]|uniref:Polyamine aminopropyltransferase n=1 Tax=Pyrodictium occultum TaxID=2309 RepID=A0A0V8RX37_PYROC|nr:spermidine synthase [Pyrodictium occultum]
MVAEWTDEGEACIRSVKKIYAAGSTRFQEYLIAELAGIGKALVLDGKVQSSLFDEHWYHEALVHPTLLSHPCPRRVLVIGGGEGATVREVLRHSCVEHVTMVDIDKELVELAKKHLPEWHQGAFDDERLELVLEDGRKFLSETSERFDAVILDLVDPMEGGPAALLYTLEFYKLVAGVLEPGGIVVTQASSPVLTPRVYATVRNTMASVFRIVRPYVTYVRSYNGLWGFVAASDAVDPAALRAADVDRLIRERIRGTLRFYDGATHEWMFTLPKPIRDSLERYTDVATDSNPVYVPV